MKTNILIFIFLMGCGEDPVTFKVTDTDTDTGSGELEDLPTDTGSGELEDLPTDTGSGELEDLPTDTGPENVCDMNGGGCDIYKDCQLEVLFVCPLLEDRVSINADTYGDTWLLCQETDDGELVCPTNEFHRPCFELKDAIGLGCL